MKKTLFIIMTLITIVMGGHHDVGAAPKGKSFSAKGKVWLEADKFTQLNGLAGYVETSFGQAFRQMFTFRSNYAVTVKDVTSKNRIKSSNVVVYTRYAPSEVGIARLTVDSSEKKRYILVEQKVTSNMGEFSPEEDDIKFDDEAIGEDIYKLTIKGSLKPGEYALVAPGGSSGYTVYDFTVEEQNKGVEKATTQQVERTAVAEEESKPEPQPSSPAAGNNVTAGSGDTKFPMNLVVATSKGLIRKSPNAGAKVLKTLKKGESLVGLKQKGDWYLVELADGETGWCLKSSVQ